MKHNFTEFGGQVEPTWSQESIRKSMFFWLGFWKPLETSTERRRSVGGASRVTLSPADSPRAAPIIKEYCRVVNKDGAGQRMTERAPLGRMKLQIMSVSVLGVSSEGGSNAARRIWHALRLVDLHG